MVTDNFIFLKYCQGFLLELRLMRRNPEEVSDSESITPKEFVKCCPDLSYTGNQELYSSHWTCTTVLVVEQKSAAQNPRYLPVQSWFILLTSSLAFKLPRCNLHWFHWGNGFSHCLFFWHHAIKKYIVNYQ